MVPLETDSGKVAQCYECLSCQRDGESRMKKLRENTDFRDHEDGKGKDAGSHGTVIGETVISPQLAKEQTLYSDQANCKYALQIGNGCVSRTCPLGRVNNM